MNGTPTLKQLEALVWVAKLGGFAPAAAKLHITASTLSKRLAELEAAIGAPLLKPGYRKARLTMRGVSVVGTAEEMLRLARALKSEAGSQELEGTIRVGATELVALTWLSRMIERLKTRHPRIVVELEIDLGMRLLKKVESSVIDLAFVPGPVTGHHVVTAHIQSVEFVLAIGSRHPTPRGAITAEQLSAYPMLMHHPEAISTVGFKRWLSDLGASPRSTIVANSIPVMVELTMNGIGISRLPTDYLADHFSSGLLRKVRTTVPLPKQDYVAVYRDDMAGDTAPTLIEFARAASRKIADAT